MGISSKYFKVKPLGNYSQYGTDMVLDENRAYWAIDAHNQPNWESEGLVFLQVDGKGTPAYHPYEQPWCFGFLLGGRDYRRLTSWQLNCCTG